MFNGVMIENNNEGFIRGDQTTYFPCDVTTWRQKEGRRPGMTTWKQATFLHLWPLRHWVFLDEKPTPSSQTLDIALRK